MQMMNYHPMNDAMLHQFTQWFEDARAHPAIRDHHAMHLSTVDSQGHVSGRIVLLKDYSAHGFCFFTNYQSRKSQDLMQHQSAALTFYWEALGRQIRIEGDVLAVDASQSDAYFASRPRASQIGAWASHQSQPLASREELMQRQHAYETEFAGKAVPRPPHWGGWQLFPRRIEFWQEGEHRLHERFLYENNGKQWVGSMLNP